MRSRRGMTMLEVIVAVALSSAVIMTGYQLFYSVMQTERIESRRDSMMNDVQNMMNRIKSDVRAGSSVSGGGGSLAITGPSGTITYRNMKNGTGMERVTSRGTAKHEGLAAQFSVRGRGAEITLSSRDTMYRRPITVEISSFALHRN